jgi:3-hydroxyisobutyrate dehydrogenase
MVNEGTHVRAVYLSPEVGILAASNLKKKYFFDCSTIDFATSLHVAEETKKREPTATFYDTPVSGGVIGAEAGTLSIMVGCTESSPDWPLVVEVFQYMALKQKVVAAGGPGLGIVAKLCNNYIAAIICLGTTEAFNWGMKAGMDPRKLRDIVVSSSGCSNHAIQHLAVPRVCPESAASREYRPGFRTELAVKDAKLAQQSAAQAGAKMVLIDSAVDTFSKVAQEYPGLDFRIMYKWLGGDMEWESHVPK